MDSKSITATATKLQDSHKVVVFKKRMLVWSSPVEYVNNMYGCHPDDTQMEYFDKVYDEKRT